MCLKNILFVSIFALALASCATYNKNKTTISSSVGYVSRDNIIIQKTRSVDSILSDANDCTFLDKFTYYTQQYNQALGGSRYQRHYRSYNYKKPVVCDPKKFTNEAILWAIEPSQNIAEVFNSPQGRQNARQFQFPQNGTAVVPLNHVKSNSCFVLTNAKGAPIPIRNQGNKYLFSNPLLAVKQAHVSKQNKVNSAKNRLHQAKSSLASTKTPAC